MFVAGPVGSAMILLLEMDSKFKKVLTSKVSNLRTTDPVALVLLGLALGV